MGKEQVSLVVFAEKSVEVHVKLNSCDTIFSKVFCASSKRFVGEVPESGLFISDKPKVGVFVDENVFEILGLAKNMDFEWIQLHGKENPKTCQLLKKQGLKIIKAFNNQDYNIDFNVDLYGKGKACYKIVLELMK